MMKKIITLTLGIILFSFLFASSNKIFAAEKVSCKTSIGGTDVSVEVSNVETYLTENGYDWLQIFIFRTTKGVNFAEVSRYKITASGTYTFSMASSRSEKGGWDSGDYEVEINTPGALRGNPAGNSCYFILKNTRGDSGQALCCPPGSSDKQFDCPFGIDYDKKCCILLNPNQKEKYGIYEPPEYEIVDKVDCLSQYAGPITCNGGEGIETALGCIPTKSPAAFVKYLLNFAIGIGGGIAFLLMIFGGLQIIFSGGNPDKVKTGKEIITAALGGLLLIIFSVFILRVIGVDILQIPGFGE